MKQKKKENVFACAALEDLYPSIFLKKKKICTFLL